MPHRHHVFDLPAEVQPPFLLRVRSEGTLTVPLTAWQPDALWQQDQNHYMVLGLYYGILLSLLIYNLFLYVALRDTLYITYSGYVFFLAIGQAGLSGVAAQFLFPNLAWLAHLTPTAGVSAAGIFGTLFVQKFLGRTPYRLRLGWLMPTLSVAYAATLVTVVSGAYNQAAVAVNLISLLFVFSAASLGIVSLIWREPGARFFVLAWLFFLLGVLVIALHNLGILPTSFVVSNAMMIGSAVEMLLLSLALGDRIQDLQHQKDSAQREAIAGRQQLLETERVHKEALESRVRDRTRELEEANRLLEIRREQLAYQASHDPLTGLANRQSFDNRVEEALQRATRNHSKLALAVIDLDDFKPVNDTYGHASGDKVLVEVARRLQAAIRQTDTLARFGGDEFVVMLEGSPSGDDLQHLRQKFADCLAEPFIVGDQQPVTVSLSIGFAVYPDDGDSVDTLFVHADNAMYYDKRRKR